MNKNIYWTGVSIFILLVFLSIGELIVGITAPTMIALLFGIAILKAFFILRDYMHLPRLFAGEEEE